MPVIERVFGVTVRVAVGPLTSDEFVARRDDRSYEATGSESEVVIDVTSRSYLLPVASVVIDGMETRPEAGWLVIDGEDVWEILPGVSGGSAVELVEATNDYRVNVSRRRGVNQCQG